MRTFYINKGKNGFQYKDATMNSAWRDLPRDITDRAGIINYFTTGQDQPMRRTYDPPELRFTTPEGKPLKHYTVSFDPTGTAFATVDFNPKTRLMISPFEIWSESKRLSYLRETAISLPDEYDTLPKALAYLQENEPLAVEDYVFETKEKRAEAVAEICNNHAKQYPGTKPIVEFLK